MHNALLITFSVGWPRIKRPEGSTLASQDFLSDLFISIKRVGKVFLLLFNVVKGLVDVVLLPFGCRYMAVESRDLSDSFVSQRNMKAAVHTFLLFSINARSQTATSPANLLNSLT